MWGVGGGGSRKQKCSAKCTHFNQRLVTAQTCYSLQFAAQLNTGGKLSFRDEILYECFKSRCYQFVGLKDEVSLSTIKEHQAKKKKYS